MEFDCVGYTAERLVTRGKITADNENYAGVELSRDGYQLLSLKSAGGPLQMGMPSIFEQDTNQEEIIMFSRQLALLLESGVGIIQSLKLLKAQTTNRALAKMLDTIVADSFGIEAVDKLTTVPGMIEPIITIVIGLGWASLPSLLSSPSTPASV